MSIRNLPDFGIYLITDSNLSMKGNLADVKAAVKGGVKVVQYRDKGLSDEDFKMEALQIQKICSENGVLFIINDRVNIAKEIAADGIHLGMDDLPLQEARELLPGKIIGVTVHNADEAVAAEKGSASYVAAAPIFATSTKSDALKPAGPELIKDVKEKVSIPVVAIGGITRGNLGQVLDAGCHNVAMVSAIVTKDDVEKEVREINEIIECKN